MDKETLSNYGWIVICILVLSVMIALATPFGQFIKTAVENTTQGLFDVSQKAGAIAGLDLPDQKFEGSGGSGGYEGTKLATPEVSIEGTILTITPVANATAYEVYNGSELLTTTSRNTTDLAVWLTAVGDYTINVKAVADGYEDSDVKTITYSIATEIVYNNFTVTSSNRNKIGYTGEENEELIIPATFYDEGSGKWYKVVKIDSYAFQSCTGLTSVTIPNSVTTIDYSAFQDSSSLVSVEIPDSVTSIGGSAFNGCTSLESVFIPDSITSLPYSTFAHCTNLKSVRLPSNLTSLGSGCFGKCSSLTSITIPESVTVIGNTTFSNCTSLTNIELPKGITKIDDGLFSGCTNLTSIAIPDNVTTIEHDAFYNCTNLTTVTFGANSKLTTICGSNSRYGYKGAFAGCTNLTSIAIPDSVTTIELQAFISCKNLTVVTFGENSQLNSIGTAAFRYCESLQSITIPGSVTSIGDYVFGSCKSLASIIIGSNVEKIGQYAFASCSALNTVTFKDNSTWYKTSNSSYSGGTNVDVSDASNAASLLINGSYFYWYKTS